METNNTYLQYISGGDAGLTNNNYLSLISGLGDQYTNNQHLQAISGLDGERTNNQYLKFITGLPYGLTNNDYLKGWGDSPQPQITNLLQWLDGRQLDWVDDSSLELLPDRSLNYSAPYIADASLIGRSPGDRYVGSDYIGSYITLATPSIINSTYFSLKFTVSAPASSDGVIYGEGNASTASYFRLDGYDGVSGKLRLRFLNDLGQTIEYVSTNIYLDGIINRCELKLQDGELTLSKNGVSEVLATITDQFDNLTTTISQIGAYTSSGSVSKDFIGYVYDFEVGGTSILINEGNGTSIHDSEGSVVGTLTDPNEAFWSNILTYDLTPQIVDAKFFGSDSRDRYIGNDYVGSWIALNTEQCLTKSEYIVEFEGFFEDGLGRAIYGEGSSVSDIPLASIQTNSVTPYKLEVRVRDASNNTVYSVETTNDIFEVGKYFKIKIHRYQDKVDFYKNDVLFEQISGLYVGEIEQVFDRKTIGCLIRSAPILDWGGVIYGFNICGTSIPINEGNGTSIHDSEGNVVGTLTDPSGTFWNNILTRSSNNYALLNTVPEVVDAVDADRAVGSDYVGSHIRLNTEPCLYKEEWYIEFKVKSLTPDDGRIYAEGNSSSNTPLLGIGAGVGSSNQRLWLLLRDDTNQPVVNAFSDSLVWDGVYREIRIWRDFDTIYLSNNGVVEVIVNDLSGEINATVNTAAIGALIRTSIISDFVGDIWDFNICGVSIPINEGSGTDIHDSDGNIVGSLIDPSVTFWNYGIVNKINLNPADNAELTARGIPNSYVTRVDIDGYNSVTDTLTYTVPADGDPSVRVLNYVDDTELAVNQQVVANAYVRRETQYLDGSPVTINGIVQTL